MKKIYLLFAIFTFALFSCNQNSGYRTSTSDQVVVQPASNSIGDNLNLQALGELVKNSKTPQDIEQNLNADNGINNLDLDGDGNRDYLKVSEYGSPPEYGYSVTAVLKDGEPEVANIVVNTQTNQYTVAGNQEYYGNYNHTYTAGFTPSDFLLMYWLTRPHYSPYISPYHYGYWGYNYAPRPIVGYNVYHTRPMVSNVRTTYRTTTTTTHKIKSPNVNNRSDVAKRELTAKRQAELSKPTQSQKSFTKRDASKPVDASGFSKKRDRSNNSSSSDKRSGYGSSKKSSSFGSSRRSSSGGGRRR